MSPAGFLAHFLTAIHTSDLQFVLNLNDIFFFVLSIDEGFVLNPILLETPDPFDAVCFVPTARASETKRP